MPQCAHEAGRPTLPWLRVGGSRVRVLIPGPIRFLRSVGIRPLPLLDELIFAAATGRPSRCASCSHPPRWFGTTVPPCMSCRACWRSLRGSQLPPWGFWWSIPTGSPSQPGGADGPSQQGFSRSSARFPQAHKIMNKNFLLNSRKVSNILPTWGPNCPDGSSFCPLSSSGQERGVLGWVLGCFVYIHISKCNVQQLSKQ